MDRIDMIMCEMGGNYESRLDRMTDQSDEKWYSHLMMIYDMMMMYGLWPRAEVWTVLFSSRWNQWMIP